MKTHSSNYKNQIKELGRELDVIVSYEENGDLIELGSEQINILDLSFESDILKSVMKKLELDSNVAIEKETIINCKIGLKVGNSFEYLDYGNYVVYDVQKKEDTNSYQIICYDKMLYAMKDYTRMNIAYPITLKNYLIAICNQMGLSFNDSNFVNYDKQILEELYLTAEGTSIGYTFRDVLDEIAQASAGTICINANDELEIRYITDTQDTIDESYLKDVNVSFGQSFGPINVVVFSRSEDADSIMYPAVAPENPIEIKIRDNQILNGNNRDEFIQGVYNQLNGLTYHLNDFVSTGITYYDLLDRYNIQVGENTYSCVMFNDEIIISRGLSENIHTDEPDTSITDYTKTSTTDRTAIKTYLIVDKQNQRIESVVSDVDRIDDTIGDRSGKQTTITQDLDRIEGEITDITDLTKSASSDSAIISDSDLEDIAPSYPIRIEIRPIVQDVSYLYPSDGLFPSDDLFLKERTLRFKNTSTNEIFDFELEYDLLYYDENNYDSFLWDYDNSKIVYTIKCDYNSSGEVVLKQTPEVHERAITQSDLDSMSLTEGNYEVSLIGYTQGYIFSRLMAINIYADQFATKMELTSAITMTKDEINTSVAQTYETQSDALTKYSEVSQKADNLTIAVGNKVGKDEIIARINLTSESATIDANKISLQGKTIDLTGDEIMIDSTNFKVDKDGNIQANDAQLDDVIIDGGSITLTSADAYEDTFKIVDTTGTQLQTFNAFMHNAEYHPDNSNDRSWFYTTANQSFGMIDLGRINYTDNYDDRVTINVQAGQPEIRIESNNLNTNTTYTTDIFSNQISTDGDMYAQNFIRQSLEEKKKNIKKYKENALDEILNTDIYTYNFKNEDDKDKKHIGFVIGDKYKYSDDFVVLDDKGKPIGADSYAMASVCIQAIKEQQKQIEELKEEINKLKGSDK